MWCNFPALFVGLSIMQILMKKQIDFTELFEKNIFIRLHHLTYIYSALFANSVIFCRHVQAQCTLWSCLPFVCLLIVWFVFCSFAHCLTFFLVYYHYYCYYYYCYYHFLVFCLGLFVSTSHCLFAFLLVLVCCLFSCCLFACFLRFIAPFSWSCLSSFACSLRLLALFARPFANSSRSCRFSCRLLAPFVHSSRSFVCPLRLLAPFARPFARPFVHSSRSFVCWLRLLTPFAHPFARSVCSLLSLVRLPAPFVGSTHSFVCSQPNPIANSITLAQPYCQCLNPNPTLSQMPSP